MVRLRRSTLCASSCIVWLSLIFPSPGTKAVNCGPYLPCSCCVRSATGAVFARSVPFVCAAAGTLLNDMLSPVSAKVQIFTKLFSSWFVVLANVKMGNADRGKTNNWRYRGSPFRTCLPATSNSILFFASNVSTLTYVLIKVLHERAPPDIHVSGSFFASPPLAIDFAFFHLHSAEFSQCRTGTYEHCCVYIFLLELFHSWRACVWKRYPEPI